MDDKCACWKDLGAAGLVRECPLDCPCEDCIEDREAIDEESDILATPMLPAGSTPNTYEEESARLGRLLDSERSEPGVSAICDFIGWAFYEAHNRKRLPSEDACECEHCESQGGAEALAKRVETLAGEVTWALNMLKNVPQPSPHVYSLIRLAREPSVVEEAWNTLRLAWTYAGALSRYNQLTNSKSSTAVSMEAMLLDELCKEGDEWLVPAGFGMFAGEGWPEEDALPSTAPVFDERELCLYRVD